MAGFDPNIPELLPHDRIYKIQVANELFNVSGASLCSDGPSFFTDYFQKHGEDADHVLFIDRSNKIFKLIHEHLQGYSTHIADEVQYTMLVADASYYRLPKLISNLMETDYFYTNIGGQFFKVPKNLFRRKGDSPNFFHVSCSVLDNDVKHYQLSKQFKRPLPQSPPFVPRSPVLFADLLSLLSGSSLNLEDDQKRNSLIKECRYYRFLNLEQRLIKSEIVFNPLTQKEDIIISLDNLKKTSVRINETNNMQCDEQHEPSPPPAKRLCTDSQPKKLFWNIINYQRPYIDDTARELIFQINCQDCLMVLNTEKKCIHLILNDTTARKFDAVFNEPLKEAGIDLNNFKLNLSSVAPCFARSSMEALILPACISICDLSINNTKCLNISTLISGKTSDLDGNSCIEPILDLSDLKNLKCSKGFKLNINKSLWRLGFKDGKLLMIGVKANTFAGKKEYCRMIDYL